MKWSWILSKAFSASIEMVRWFLSLLLLICICWITHVSLGWSQLGHGDWSSWYVVGFRLPLFYWGFLHLCSFRRLAYSSPFGCDFVCFWDVIVILKNELWSVPSLFISWKSKWSIGISSSLKVW
jgi:hypothetical protein